MLTPPFFPVFWCVGMLRRDVMKGLHTVTVVAIFLLKSGVGALLVWIRLAGAKRRFATELEKALFGRLRNCREKFQSPLRKRLGIHTRQRP